MKRSKAARAAEPTTSETPIATIRRRIVIPSDAAKKNLWRATYDKNVPNYLASQWCDRDDVKFEFDRL